jgi:ACS family tartrate transporter-like MFS transporter
VVRAVALQGMLLGALPLTIALIIVARACTKAYQPPFWCLPTLFLSSTAAAACIGLINSIGNLGGFLGPTVIGHLEHVTGSFQNGILFLSALMLVAGGIVFFLRLGDRPTAVGASAEPRDDLQSEKREATV